MLPLVKRSVVLSVSSGSSFVEAEGQDGGEEESRLRRERRSIGLAKCLRALSSRLLVFLSVWPPVSPVVLLSGEHELEQGLSLSSSLISAHHLHPERFMKRIKRSREEEREGENRQRRREDWREFRRFRMSGGRKSLRQVFMGRGCGEICLPESTSMN